MGRSRSRLWHVFARDLQHSATPSASPSSPVASMSPFLLYRNGIQATALRFGLAGTTEDARHI
eukprot:6212369-Pleurochrysis_carterae.AAC.2